jgi:hypothetical protein
VADELSDLIQRIGSAGNAPEARSLAEHVVPGLIAYWDRHPHSAMEVLEWAVREMPLALSHAVARRVVEAWKRKPTYDPDAGGSADHCFLSALILSENLDLADPEWARRLLPRTLQKDEDGRRLQGKPDADARLEIVRVLSRAWANVPGS